MESTEQQLNRCLTALRKAGPDARIDDVLWADLPALLANDAIAQLLVTQVAALDDETVDEADPEKALLECLLDEARRAAEDDRPAGRQFLTTAEAALDGLDAGATRAAGTIGLGTIWHRAGLPVPPAVRSLQATHLGAEESAETHDPAALAASLADSITEMRGECGDDPYAVYTMLGDSMAGLPDSGCEALIHEIARWDGVFWQQLALYWLFDPRSALRRAAGVAIRQLADTGAIDDEVAGRLAWLRHLLPADETRQTIDDALTAYRKRHRGWPQPHERAALDQARASVPDGAGAQYLALGRQGAAGYDWSMVLIKSGHGVRDAYVLKDLDPDAEQELWTTLADAADLRRVDRATVLALLAAAVAENHAKGDPPTPGLIDVAATNGLTDLRPRSVGGREWLGEFDPDGRLADLTPQKRGRLINRSGRWHEELDVVASWFEDSTEARAILEREAPGDRQEQALRDHLETRRAWWAELCLRSALVVRHEDTEGLADSLAVTGLALLEGREFTRVPLLSAILEGTIAVHEEDSVADELPMPDDDRDEGEAFAHSDVLVDPAQARLQPLFDNEPVAGRWPGGYFGLHGYLFAIATHPDIVPPSQWIGPVFEPLQSGSTGLDQESDANTLLTDLCNLYNRINERVLRLYPGLPQGCVIHADPNENVGPNTPLGQWSLGFRHAREHFGHLADVPFEASDELQEGVGLAIEMIEYLGRPDAVTDTSSADRVEHLAAMACEHLYENLHILCAARMSQQTGMDEMPDAAIDHPPSNGTGRDGEWLTPEQILARLDDPRASYQWEAMEQAVAQRAAIKPLLLERLEEVAADPGAWIRHDQAGLLYAVALLSHFAEPAAHEPLLRLASLPEEVQDPLLGDVTTEFLPVALWRTSARETTGLKRLLEDRSAYGFGRGAAADALVFGALFGALDRNEINAYLASLLQDRTFAEPHDPVWSEIVQALLDLYPADHEAVIRDYFRRDNRDPFGMVEADLDQVLARDRDKVLEQAFQNAARRFPDDVHGYLSNWAGFRPSESDPFDPWGEDPFLAGPLGSGYDPDFPPPPGSARAATKSSGPSPDKKKKKRKQQKKARKTNRKRR